MLCLYLLPINLIALVVSIHECEIQRAITKAAVDGGQHLRRVLSRVELDDRISDVFVTGACQFSVHAQVVTPLSAVHTYTTGLYHCHFQL